LIQSIASIFRSKIVQSGSLDKHLTLYDWLFRSTVGTEEIRRTKLDYR
jgi:hypothetical protein